MLPITARQIINLGELLKLSHAIFIGHLLVNQRTPENREQGWVKPNAQAVLLLQMTKRYPDTVPFSGY